VAPNASAAPDASVASDAAVDNAGITAGRDENDQTNNGNGDV
jgi:hypothetical protein